MQDFSRHDDDHQNKNMKKVLVSGANGFIGRALLGELLQNEDVQVVALSRQDRKSSHPRLTWKKCDLYSLKDLKESLASCEIAYYLVHSMLPSAGLTQGEFYDFDLLMADNFVRAANQAGTKRIIYLGGLIPVDQENLSWHLKSRLEVEKTLRDAKCELIALRAALIIGKNGSSFVILRNLVKRLRVMILPPWTKSKSEPIALPDVIRILVKCLDLPIDEGNAFDLGGREKLSYRDLILRTSVAMNKPVKAFHWNLVSVKLSRLWVSLISGAPKNLVYPLVLSLKHDMLVNPKYAWPDQSDIRVSLNEALSSGLIEDDKPEKLSPHFVPIEKDVRSIQRLTFPAKKNAEWVADEYFRWIPKFGRPFLRVNREENKLYFRFLGFPADLLVIEKSEEYSSPDRQLLYIRGGILAKKAGRGRLEFREVLDQKYIMAAIHDYRPSLPWIFYKFTQAKVHLFVMRAFEKHLKSI